MSSSLTWTLWYTGYFSPYTLFVGSFSSVHTLPIRDSRFTVFYRHKSASVTTESHTVDKPLENGAASTFTVKKTRGDGTMQHDVATDVPFIGDFQ